MKLLVSLLAGLFVLSSNTDARAQKGAASEPIAWGVVSGNSSCVIFAEGKKTSGHFYGIAVTTKTVGKLTTIESTDANFTDKEVLETQENMDRLNERSRADHVKFVKIPEKYSPELLDKARATCKTDAQ